MRPSSRTRILDAVIDLIQRDGVTAVTYDAVAEETGMTRGGLLYHFPSREDLIRAAHDHLAGRWDARMAELAGKPADAATPDERHAAYIGSCVETATRAELLLMLESVSDPGLSALWETVMDRWSPPVPDKGADDAHVLRFIARLAADGLWIYEATGGRRLPPEMRDRIRARLVEMGR